ncbi:cytidine/deoxycytidylate deaminase, zinc-binding region [Rhodopseudomonas palustris BisB18]|uniref:Cytidine/deoxycytidylate deaminase, zinc-binding region n=1 Tax=Rhodopseudomonas palustris (strain BisB18) TaxID=316056 RepID=Q217V7_RHOPB
MSVKRIAHPELFFGLVAPVGVDLDMIMEVLSTELTLQKYSAFPIHITEIMQDVPSNLVLKNETYLDRINSRIEYADEICSRIEREDALAAIAITAIQSVRERLNRELAERAAEKLPSDARLLQERLQLPIPKQAYLIRQFKRPKEIGLLRQVYGKLFFQISAYSSPAERELLLKKKIKASNFGGLEDSEAECQAISLMAKDYQEADKPYGQQIRETFPLGDVFVDGVNRKNCEAMIKRFVNLIFGDNSLTPDHHEYGMYLAKSAALRSGDLSRQVGAAIFRASGEVATLGCNEVPKYGGGSYWSDGSEDRRDFALGEDPNERIKREILHDILETLFERKKLAEQINSIAAVRDIMQDDALRKSKVMDLLEFGRVIHAEMSAITDAARLGIKIKSGTLFCTTFPCHICAKHIVASGIDTVVFLEPYPKSYARELHSDSIEIEGDEEIAKVKFTPFLGISPLRYRDFFEKGRRKDKETGKIIRWTAGIGVPIIEIYYAVYINLETLVSNELKQDKRLRERPALS